MGLGIEIELIVLLLIQLIGTSLFARFEIETPVTKKISKWFIIHVLTITMFYWIGHYAIIFPFFIVLLGSIVHVNICRKNGIDPIKATPRKKYYALRGWEWKE